MNIRNIYVVILLSFALAACGGGSASNYSSGTNPAPVIPVPRAPAPIVTVTAASSAITYGGNTIISWITTNSDSCTSSGGGLAGTTGAIRSFNTGTLTSTTSYTVTCVGAGGSATQGITVIVAASAITGFVNTGGTGNITATSANNLTGGMIITISGTANYDGTYTVISATPTNFVIPATWVSASQTGTWQLAGGKILGCSTTGNAGAIGAITLSNAPSRFTGVAPLSVFFDASGTTATSTSRPFHDLEYRWDFGDEAGSPVNGQHWKADSRAGESSRNSATGPVAAHVFETPGVYTVALTSTDGTNTVSNNCARIVVQDPEVVFAGTNTVCIGAAIAPVAGENGCPAGASVVTQSNFATAVNTYALAGKRVLFKRGDTFFAPTSAAISRTGPGILGAFGTELASAPVVQMTGTEGNLLTLSGSNTPTIKDWRIMDLEFDGLGKSRSRGIGAMGGINQVLILRMNIKAMDRGISFSDSILTALYLGGMTAHAMFDELAIVDSTITPISNASSDMRIFASSNRGSIQGNTLGSMTNSSYFAAHIVRIPHMAKGVISNNIMARPGSTQLALKLHGQAWCDSTTSQPGSCDAPDNGPLPTTYGYKTNTHPIGIFAALSGYTEQVVVSDNKIVGAENPYTMSVASQNTRRDERMRDIIVERNWFTAGTGTQLSLYFVASNSTIRNNIFDMTNVTGRFIDIVEPGSEPPVSNIGVYNNTFYTGSAGNYFTGVTIGASATNVTVMNNLGSAPQATNPRMIVGTGASGFVQSNNLLNNTPLVDLFVSIPPLIPADFRLKAGSNPARDKGLSSVPVHSDFFLSVRPQGVATDIGAVESP